MMSRDFWFSRQDFLNPEPRTLVLRAKPALTASSGNHFEAANKRRPPAGR
jgi:hypothetical protein